MVFPGFNRRRKGTISNGDWDRDGVKNRNDCEPLNFRKQGPEHESDEELIEKNRQGGPLSMKDVRRLSKMKKQGRDIGYGGNE